MRHFVESNFESKKVKAARSLKISQDTEEYIRRGGKVTILSAGESGDQRVGREVFNNHGSR